MSSHQEDLDLLLSLQDRVLETPPQSPGYLSDDGSPRRTRQPDMSVFRNAVEDCLDFHPEPVKKAPNLKKNEADVEKFSGLRIRNQLVSSVELSSRLSDIRFVRLLAIKNLLVGDILSGCWATIGVLTEKGSPKTSSAGKNYCIWKIGCLDEDTVSVFLFGDAYQKNRKEQAGTVFALFNSGVRKDAMGKGFSLSIYSPGQILKLGTSVDYGVCKGKRKDGLACTLVINKRRGAYCRYHKSKASEKYSINRTELKGGNLKTAFRDPLTSEGVYFADPLADKTDVKRPMQPVKLLSVDGLRKALSNASKVTTNAHSQGIRFLTELTGKVGSKVTNEGSGLNQQGAKRPSTAIRKDSSAVARNQQTSIKRKKTEQEQTLSGKEKMAAEKMIELDFVSSDEEF